MKKLIRKLNDIFKIGHCFGFKYALYEFFIEIAFKKIIFIKKYFIIKRNNSVKKYLYKKYNYVFNDYQNIDTLPNKIESDSKVFVFWWQGFDNCPEIVSSCLKSIKKHLGNHELIMLSAENFSDYVKFPDYILEKLENKEISLTHFSDLLRVSLLEKYGGIWLDATIFINREYDNEIYNYSFYTVKHGLYADYHICRGKWTTSVFMSSKNNFFMSYIKHFLLEYWKNENFPITYLFLDCIISLGYDYIDEIKNIIDAVPMNNTDIFKIEKYYTMPYEKEKFDIDNSQTYLYKMNYKRKLIKEQDGHLTFYGEILRRCASTKSNKKKAI